MWHILELFEVLENLNERSPLQMVAYQISSEKKNKVVLQALQFLLYALSSLKQVFRSFPFHMELL